MMQKSSLAKIVWVALLLTIVGCAKTPPNSWENPSPKDRAPRQEVSIWPSLDAGSFRQSVAKVCSLPNIGLQLPVASPDGRWVAALCAHNVEEVDPDATLSGRTLEAVSLVLFDIEHPKVLPRVIATNAAWPVWSHDSRTLYSVAYDKSRRCGILVTDVATAKSRRLEISIDHIITPSLSPTGSSLAFAAFAQVPQQAKLYSYRLDQQQLNPLPVPKEMVWQIMPQWVDEHALVYYGHVGAETALYGASIVSADRNVRLAQMKLPSVAADVIQAQAGLVNPFKAITNCLATFEPDQQRVVLTHLNDVQSTPLGATSQAGIWAEDPRENRFVYGTGKELCVQTVGGESRLLAAQQLIPIWCSPGGSTMLALAPGQLPWTFDLIKLKFESAM